MKFPPWIPPDSGPALPAPFFSAARAFAGAAARARGQMPASGGWSGVPIHSFGGRRAVATIDRPPNSSAGFGPRPMPEAPESHFNSANCRIAGGAQVPNLGAAARSMAPRRRAPPVSGAARTDVDRGMARLVRARPTRMENLIKLRQFNELR